MRVKLESGIISVPICNTNVIQVHFSFIKGVEFVCISYDTGFRNNLRRKTHLNSIHNSDNRDLSTST